MSPKHGHLNIVLIKTKTSDSPCGDSLGRVKKCIDSVEPETLGQAVKTVKNFQDC